MIKTYKYKLYKTKRLKHLHRLINISAGIYNHCIALHKRYYRLYGKTLNKYVLQKHITKVNGKVFRASNFRLLTKIIKCK